MWDSLIYAIFLFSSPLDRYARSVGLAETVSARKFLEAAMICGDSDVFYSTFTFFGLRNAKLRGSSAFAKGRVEKCHKNRVCGGIHCSCVFCILFRLWAIQFRCCMLCMTNFVLCMLNLSYFIKYIFIIDILYIIPLKKLSLLVIISLSLSLIYPNIYFCFVF